MRKYTIAILLILPFFVAGQTIKVNITPDQVWHDGSKTWCDRGFATTFFNFQGTIYVFNVQKPSNTLAYYPYVYTMNLHHDNAALANYNVGGKNYIDYFGYPHEHELGNYPNFLGRSFCFQYNGRLWYYQQIQRSTDCQNPCNESYECFAQMPEDQAGQYHTYYVDNNPLPDVYLQGGFQFDSNMYFVGMNHNSKSSHYNQWVLQEFRFDESQQKFVKVREQYSAFMWGTELGGIVRKIDEEGTEFLILNTYTINSTNSSGLFKLVPNIGSDGTREFTITSYNSGPYPFEMAATITDGSVKGNKTSDGNPGYPDRLGYWSINSSTSSDGTHHIAYVEYKNYTTGYSGSANYGELSFPSSSPPGKAGDYYQVVGTYELVPTDLSAALEGFDSYQQYIWLFYPDKDKHFNGARLTSDFWTLDDDPTHIITSDDELTDTVQFPGINNLWTLTGIVEGGPPVSVNWPRWDSLHAPLTPASTLTFETGTTKLTDVTTSREDKWSIGESMDLSTKTSKALSGSMSEEFKYSNTYKKTIQGSFSLTRSEGVTYELFEDNQEYGKFIWRIPQIRRFTYKCYPWWDNANSLQYPIPYTTQYLFRTFGFSTTYQAVPLEDDPFYVGNPNDPSMSEWKRPARDVIYNNAVAYGLQPMNINWNTLNGGDSDDLDVSVDHSSGFESTNTYEATATFGVTGKVPKVFELEVTGTGSYEVNYSTEASVSTEFEQNITASLEELGSTEDGLFLEELKISIFWFRPETYSDWWFFQDLAGQKPWYMAYVVTTANEALDLVAPSDASEMEPSELMFSWQAENGELGNYTFYISSSPVIARDNTLYQAFTGDITRISVTDFKPEPGITYYWAVRGFNKDGEMVWSSKRTFMMRDEGQNQPVREMKALVYPNPAREGGVHILIDPQSEGRISVRLSNVNGTIVASREGYSTDSSPVDFFFDDPILTAGIYFAVITTDKEQVVKKVVINISGRTH